MEVWQIVFAILAFLFWLAAVITIIQAWKRKQITGIVAFLLVVLTLFLPFLAPFGWFVYYFAVLKQPSPVKMKSK